MRNMSDSDLELYGIVGKMFREIRKRKELSLETVAEYLKIAPKSLQRYECGERKIKTGTIKELCIFYKINYDVFIKEAKLRFGKNIYDTDTQKEEFPKIIQYYNILNDIGKHVATERVRELTEVPRYSKEKINDVNAAHSIPDSNNEDIIHDEEIMDDENF